MIIKKLHVICIVMALLLIFSSGMPVSASSGASFTEEIQKSVKYLHSMQNRDGGFPYREGQESSQSVSCWVIQALDAAGEDVNNDKWAPGGKNPIDFLNNSKKRLNNTCDYARTLMSLSAAHQGKIYHGRDLVQDILSFQQEDGQFARISAGEKGFINSHMWSILALDSAGVEIPRKDQARQWLIEQQNSDGGFGWCEGIPSDADDTAIAIQVLIVLGEDPLNSDIIKSSLSYLKSCQGEDGGFSSGYLAGNRSNASSDAWVIQALLVSGQDPISSAWSINKDNALTHLLDLQHASGFFYYMADTVAGPTQTTAAALQSLGRISGTDNHQAPAPGPGASPLHTFSDISKAHWAYPAMIELLEAEVIKGYPDKTFKPENPVSRAEFAAMLVKGMSLASDAFYGDTGFTDVAQDYWAARYIMLCVQKEYIKGMPGGVFQPGQNISGAQLAAILARTLPVEVPAATGPSWYTEYVKIAADNGLLYPGFDPERAASRAQCAYSIVKLRDMAQVN